MALTPRATMSPMSKSESPAAGTVLIVRRHPGAEGFVYVPAKGDVVQPVHLGAEYDLFESPEQAAAAAESESPEEVWIHTECYDEDMWRDYFIFAGGTYDDDTFPFNDIFDD